MEEELLTCYGIPIIVTSNKRKSLTKSSLIINIDFNNQNINQYNINENAIIINLNEEIKIEKKRFNGFVISDYEIDIKKDDLEKTNLYEEIEKRTEFFVKDILEEKIHSNVENTKEHNRFYEVRNVIEKNKVYIRELIGKNGSLNQNI